MKAIPTLINLILESLAVGAAASANANAVIYDNLGAASSGFGQVNY